jgi:hypothetical protein
LSQAEQHKLQQKADGDDKKTMALVKCAFKIFSTLFKLVICINNKERLIFALLQDKPFLFLKFYCNFRYLACPYVSLTF